MRIFLGLLAACTSIAMAQEGSDVPFEPEPQPEEVLVTGEFPGPGMWKVTRPDDADHVLWILGAPPPLPKRMDWKSKEVETVIVRSQEVLLASRVDVKPDEKIGFFKRLSLLPAALSVRKNPEDGRLEDLVDAETHSRWQVQKKRFLGPNDAAERWRPIYAAYKLRREALDDLKLRDGDIVRDVVLKLAEKHEIKTTIPLVELPITTKDIKKKIKEFAREPLADTECFARTLDLVEALSQQDTMEQRAISWATGDLTTLQTLPALPSPNLACETAVMGSGIAQQMVPRDLRAKLRSAWLDAAESSLAANPTTFALLPMAELTSADGQLAALRAKGYKIAAPESAER
jgi:hypothetical protein